MDTAVSTPYPTYPPRRTSYVDPTAPSDAVLSEAVNEALEANSGCCLDNDEERARVLAAVLKASELVTCDACSHLSEVHLVGGCLGGPVVDCACKGFVKDDE